MFNDIFSLVDSLHKGTFGMVFETSTEPKMRKTNNPFYGRVRKVSRVVNSALGYDYETYVNARLERADLPSEFKASPLPWGEWVEGYEGIVISHKGKTYLRMTILPNTTAKPTYMVDGRVATDEELAVIKTFLQEPSYSNKQAACGLVEQSAQVSVRAYAVENIISIKQGEVEYERPVNFALIG